MITEITDNPAPPFHAGELAVQERMGVREAIAPWARQVVRPYMPEQHRAFYQSLPFMVAAARDPDGSAWATLLTGPPGFIKTPDEFTLSLATQVTPGDALDGVLVAGADIGLLGIAFDDRRRNRINGRISQDTNSGLTVRVDQTFGNCPQYILPREWMPATPTPIVRNSHDLDTAQAAWIAAADTFFVASGHRGTGDDPAFGMDASHRGGPAGFVAVEDPRTLVFPDFAGNNHYNTLGNLMLDPRIGLLFVDFERGSLLQLSGRAQIDWDMSSVPADSDVTQSGAKRLVRVTIERVVELKQALPMRWRASGHATRALRVIGKQAESADVTSFYLTARDGGELPPFAPGQHLPIELEAGAADTAITRTYSLSSAPGDAHYRISVKREPQGLASRFLHDRLDVGDFLNAATPAGDFVLRKSTRPVVLLSAGIGITPMMSMLAALADDSSVRPVTFVHSARDGEHHAFAAAVKALADAHEHIRTHTIYSQPRAADVQGQHYDARGRLSAGLLSVLVSDMHAECYVCGPAGFLGAMTAALQSIGIAESRIFTERFGA